MKNKINRISGYFKVEKLKNDKRIIVFLVCLLIATTLWFLNALSKDYSTTISYPVKYIAPPKNQFVANELPAKLELKVNAHGFTLLRHKLNLSFSPIILNLSTITRNLQAGSEGYQVNSNSLIRRISDQISSEISITGIQPENIVVKLDSLKSKMVPVRANFEYSFKPQFSLKEDVKIQPAEVKITGPAAVLDTIFYVLTEKKQYKQLDSDLEKSLSLLHSSHTTVNPGKVLMKIPVEKFTEKKISIPIKVRNQAGSTSVKLFPSEVELTVLVGLSEFENVDATQFDIKVDFKEISPGKETLEVYIESKPSYVQIVRYTPESVEYLIETN